MRTTMSARLPARLGAGVLSAWMLMAAGCGMAMPTGSRPAPELQSVFDSINQRAFDGKLSAEIWTGRDAECYGRSSPFGGRGGGPVVIVDSGLSGKPLEAVMAHEMVHLYLHGDLLGSMTDGGHGPRFQAECARVAARLGLPAGMLTGDPYRHAPSHAEMPPPLPRATTRVPDPANAWIRR